MVRLLLLLALSSSSAHGVWNDELFGRPQAAYFRGANSRLLNWILEKYELKGALTKDQKRFLELCANESSTWYHPSYPSLRLSIFSVRFSYDPASQKKDISVRCLPVAPSDELNGLGKKLAAKGKQLRALGLEFSLNHKGRWRAILEGGELKLHDQKLVKETKERVAFQDGAPPGEAHFPFPWLVQAWSEEKSGGKKQYRLELRAFMDGLAPKELRADIEALHREFGLLADSILYSPREPTEVFFP